LPVKVSYRIFSSSNNKPQKHKVMTVQIFYNYANGQFQDNMELPLVMAYIYVKGMRRQKVDRTMTIKGAKVFLEAVAYTQKDSLDFRIYFEK
jgi:hypothetical protein